MVMPAWRRNPVNQGPSISDPTAQTPPVIAAPLGSAIVANGFSSTNPANSGWERVAMLWDPNFNAFAVETQYQGPYGGTEPLYLIAGTFLLLNGPNYVQLSSGGTNTVYTDITGLWMNSGTLHPGGGPSQPAGAGLWSNSGVPPASLGSNGDYYFRTDAPSIANERIYVKSAGAWLAIL